MVMAATRGPASYWLRREPFQIMHCPPSQEDQEQALSARGPQGHTAVRIPGDHPPEISSGEDSGKVALEEEQQHKEL